MSTTPCLIAAGIVLAFAGLAHAAAKRDASKIDRIVSELRPLIEAIGEVETGGMPESKRDAAIGDEGRALGRYQIHLGCAIDVGHAHADAHNPATARRIMAAYWLLYAPDAIESRDYQRLARVWNGGPRGHLKQSTAAYWERVRLKL